MKRFYFVLSIVAAVGLVFTGGFAVAKTMYDKPVREVLVGYSHEERKDEMVIKHSFTDREDLNTVDNLQQIMMFSEVREAPSNLGERDVMITVRNPQHHVSLTTTSVWFEGDGAWLGFDDKYRWISQEDAAWLKKAILFEE
ncbi:hypothetical protein [Jeotgalibacillus sp. R-1-5s-1]|uniref:hypothetical protein n=1 Tax=Jeotgalibacillus sp. R-1-5s-1 TaxID=2555897 RepID=UPI00106BE2BB|nr:hypothetical protein [Jeotgalibacillus sp. R-1-5s-1]TFE00172.1 hypothetical protein E2491_06980 [Jeotgalibacillus sp. R-1-5s-1]